MPIELICQGCAKKLRMKESDAGKTARCPSCRTTFTVPERAEERSFSGDAARFYVRRMGASQSGPHSQAELDRMASSGELNASCEVKQETSDNWLPATHFYPTLGTQAPVESGSPFAERAPTDEPATEQAGDASPASANPYASPAAVTVTPRRRFLKPHRGGTILAMGVAGFCVCWFLGIGAFFMGMKDLGEMSKGTMDPSGRTLTAIGMTMGGVSTAMHVLAFVIAAVNN